MVIDLISLSNTLANFSKNFYSRTFFRYLSVLITTLTIYFLIQVESTELATFFLIRSAIRIFSVLSAPLSGGEIFYKKFAGKIDFNHAFIMHFIISSFFICLIGLILTLLLYFSQFFLDFISFSTIELSLIFIWFLSITIGNIFPHYFQIKKQDILSGASNGFFAQLILFISLLFLFEFSNISFFNLLAIFSLSYLLNTIIFILYLFASHIKKISLRNVNFDYFLDKKLYVEMIIDFFNQSPSILLWISAFFLETQALLIFGFFIYLQSILTLIKGAFRFSIREEWINSFLDKTKFKSTYYQVRKNLLIVNSLIIILLYTSKLMLNSGFHIFDDFKYIFEINYALNMMLIYFHASLVIDYLYVALANIMVLYGSVVKFLGIKAIATFIPLFLLIFINLFSPSLFSFICTIILMQFITNFLSHNHFINLKHLNYDK